MNAMMTNILTMVLLIGCTHSILIKQPVQSKACANVAYSMVDDCNMIYTYDGDITTRRKATLLNDGYSFLLCPETRDIPDNTTLSYEYIDIECANFMNSRTRYYLPASNVVLLFKSYSTTLYCNHAIVYMDHIIPTSGLYLLDSNGNVIRYTFDEQRSYSFEFRVTYDNRRPTTSIIILDIETMRTSILYITRPTECDTMNTHVFDWITVRPDDVPFLVIWSMTMMAIYSGSVHIRVLFIASDAYRVVFTIPVIIMATLSPALTSYTRFAAATLYTCVLSIIVNASYIAWKLTPRDYITYKIPDMAMIRRVMLYTGMCILHTMCINLIRL
jgi:hypothetical protein